MGPENHPLKTTLIHTTHPPSPPKPPHPRHPYTRQNSLSQPNPPNLNRNLNLNLDLTPFRGPSCDRLLAHERQKQRLAQKAAQGMIFLYAHGAASAHHNAASLTTRPSPPSPGNATSPPASAPTDPWKIDIVPPRPGPRIQYSAFRAPPASSSSANTADPFANPVPADSHAPAPPRHDPASTPARCDDHLLALLALSASPAAADDACSDTASVRERLRKQSVERVQRWRARNEEMMGGGEKGGESGGRAVRRVKGVVGLRGVLRRFGSS